MESVVTLEYLELDLTEKSMEEVLEILNAHGFKTEHCDGTSAWDHYESFLRKKESKGPPVQILRIQDSQKPYLKAKLFNGKWVTLGIGQDLHLFERPKEGYPSGPPEWGRMHTYYLTA
jgi:hypothetical protein